MSTFETFAHDHTLEVLAHRFAYDDLEANGAATAELAGEVKAYGFKAVKQVKGKFGFSMTVFESISRKGLTGDYLNHAPEQTVIVFRGTNDPIDLYVDLAASAVGRIQLNNNSYLIRQTLNEIKGKSILTGHSLGGALAQLSAVLEPDKVNSIVTFQSPGIEYATTKMINLYNVGKRQPITSRHYRSSEGIVSEAGESMTFGFIYEVDVSTVDYTNYDSSNNWLPQEGMIGRWLNTHFFYILDYYLKNQGNLIGVPTSKWQRFRPIEYLRRGLFEIMSEAFKAKNIITAFVLGLSFDNLIVNLIKHKKEEASLIAPQVRTFFIEWLLGYPTSITNKTINQDEIFAIRILILSADDQLKEMYKEKLYKKYLGPGVPNSKTKKVLEGLQNVFD